MNRLLLFTLLAILFGAAVNSLAADLVHLEAKQAPVENGKTLEMRFRELERSESNSIVEVTFVSGGSVSSSMFVLHGMCAVARARGANYFTSEQIEGQPTRYKVTFPHEGQAQNDRKAASHASSSRQEEHVFSIAECAMLGF